MTDSIRWDDHGLVAAVVQDDSDGSILMLGWMNSEALDRTRATGRVHFWSRSRQALWEKGATSGNRLDLVAMTPDCDGDALLVRARPKGPTCHTGDATCFGARRAGSRWTELDDLVEVISHRQQHRPEGSYTARLVEQGVEHVGRKVVEEATELLLAAKDHASGAGADRRVAEEAADLVFHVLVLLAEREIDPAAMLDVLADRSRESVRLPDDARDG